MVRTKCSHFTPVSFSKWAALLSLMFCASTFAETIIGIDFIGRTGNGIVQSPMAPTESAGLIPRTHWTSVAPNELPGTATNLVDQNGSITTAQVTWNNNDAWHTDSGSDTPGNQRMMLGYINVQQGNTITVAVSALPASFANINYNVYVYLGTDSGANYSDYTLTAGSASYTVRGGWNNPTVTAGGGFIKANGFDGSFGGGNGKYGNYLVFSNIKGSSFSVSSTAATARAGITGIQIVQTDIANPPILAAGWNADVVQENTASFNAVAFDATPGTSTWFEARNGRYSDGLPPGGIFLSENDATTRYQLQPYNANNCLLIATGATQRLTLLNPGKIGTFRILAASSFAQPTTTGTFVLNFSDNTSSSPMSFNAFDWSSLTPTSVGYSNMGRSDGIGSNFVYSGINRYNLYETQLTLNTAKSVKSIDFAAPAGIGNTGVFALSGAVTPDVLISSISPNSGPTAGGTANITLTGAGFQTGATVKFGTQSATSVVVVGATQITVTSPATSPAGTTGLVNVTVTNPDGTTFTFTNGFNYSDGPPAISAVYLTGTVTPATGPYNASTVVDIIGTSFSPNVSTISFGTQPALNITYVNGTKITCTVQPELPNTSSICTCVLTNPDGFTATLPNAFTYTGLREPENDTGVQNTLYYRYFHDTTLVTAILPGPAIPLAYTGTPAVALTGFIDNMDFAQNPIPGRLAIDGSDHYAIEYIGFLRVPADGLWTLYTASDDGTFFFLGDATANTLVVSDNFSQPTTERSGTIALKAGLHRFRLQYTENDGGDELHVRWEGPTVAKENIPRGDAAGTARGFYGESPITLSSAIPTPSGAMPKTGGQPLTITGTGLGSYVNKMFIKDAGGTTIGTYFSPGTPPNTFAVPSTTTINGLNSPQAFSSGPASVMITTIGGQSTTLGGGLPNGLAYAGSLVKLLTPGGLAPVSGPSSGNLLNNYVTITADPSTPTFSATGVMVKLDAGYPGTGTISSSGTSVTGTGTTFLQQVQPGDVVSSSGQSLPVQAVTNANTLITLGSFSPAITAGSTFTLLKSAATIDPSHIKFLAPPHAAGTADLTVINGDGQAASNALIAEYTYLPPTLAAVNFSPANSNLTSGGNTVTVTGTNFGVATSITFGGALGTNLVINSNTMLTVTVPPAPGGIAGPVDVVVSDNQTPAGTSTLPGGYTYINRTADFPTSTGFVPGLAVKFFPNTINTDGLVPTAGPTVFDNFVTYLGKNVNTSVAAGPNLNVSPGTILSLVPVNSLNFFTKINGYLQINTPGVYTIYTASDDGTLFYIDNTLIVTNNVSQPVTERSGQIGLGVGLHKFTIIYGQGGGGYGLSFSYNGPDTNNTQVIIPDSVLWSDPGPTLTSLDVTSGASGGNTIVTATGTGFVAGAQITVGGNLASSVVVNSNTSITFKTPGGAPGPANVVLINPNGTADTLFNAFTFDSTIARDPDFLTTAAAGAVPGAYYRYYYSGVAETPPGTSLLPTFANFVPYRLGALANAQFLPESQFHWPTANPDNVNGWAYQHNGYINIPNDGTYNFFTASDDGSRMFIDAQMVVDNNFAQGVTTRGGTAVKLKAGLHRYTVQFSEGGGGYGNYVAWSSADAGNAALLPVDPVGTGNHAGQPTSPLIPDSAYFYVPPTFIGAGTSNWSTAASWNTNYGFGAFAPVETNNTEDTRWSSVYRFAGSGAAPYTAVNDSVNNTPFYVIELNSNVNGNVISGNGLKTLGTTGYPYNSLARPNIIQNGSGSVTISADVFDRDSLDFSGNGTGIVTLSGALTNYAQPGDVKSITKNGNSIFVLSGNGTGFTNNGGTNANININGGVLAVNGTLGSGAGVAAFVNTGARLRGTGTFSGPVTVTGTLFPGDATSTLTNQPLGQLAVGAADFGNNAGTLRIRAYGTTASNLISDSLKINSNQSLVLEGSSTLQLVLQAPESAAFANKDTLIVDLGTNTNTGAFANISTLSSTAIKILYVDNTFTVGGSTGILATQDTSGVVTGSPTNYNRIFVRLNGSVTPATIAAFSAKAEGAGVLVSWKAISEFRNAGFDVFRRSIDGSEWVKVNASLIAGRITHPDAKEYALYDWATPGVYQYKLESVGLQGERECYGELAAAVRVDATNTVAVSDVGISAANDSIESAANTILARELSASFAAHAGVEPTIVRPNTASLVRQNDGTLLMPATVTILERNSGAMAANAPAISASTRSAPATSSATPSAGTRWFAASPASTSSAFNGVKVVYDAAGVLLIPAASLPPGFNINHLAIQREGRTLTPLAQTAEGLVVFGPGYQDDYTDKDAFFLRHISGQTTAGQIARATGLFSSSIIVNTSTSSSVTHDYHEVYFDFDLRPYDFAPWFASKYLSAGASTGTTQSFALETPFAGGASSLTVNLWSLTQSESVAQDHALQVLVNGTPIGQAAWSGGGKMLQLTFQVPAGILNAAGNTIELVTPPIEGVSSQIAFLHSLTFSYTRALDGSKPVTINTTGGAKVYELNNLPGAGAWVVDARYPDRAALVAFESQPDGNKYKLRFTAAGGGTGQYFVVPFGRENLPLAISRRQLKPVKPGAGTYWAVGPAQFNAGVQPLLAQHNREGIRGSFIDQEQLFDYYNYGRYGPSAIQKAVRALRPQYLLLLGRTTYDYRNYTGANVDPMCPTFLVSTSFWAQATSDSMFGDLGRGYPEAAIGRLPVNNTEELSGAVRHILNYAGAPVSGVRVHAAADQNDPVVANFPAQAATLGQSFPDMTWQADYLGVTYQTPEEVTAAMTSAANGGADWIVYIGHGNASHLGAANRQLLGLEDLPNWTGNVVLLQATCTANWMAKNSAGYKSIAIQALTQPQGGICAGIGSSTYMNSDCAVDFMTQLLKNADGSNARWGVAVMKTQQWASQKGSGFYSDLNKTEQIFGDPAMKVFMKGGPVTTPPTTGGTGSTPVTGTF